MKSIDLKNTLIFLLTAIQTITVTIAQDTMYIAKKDGEIIKIQLQEIDSIVFYPVSAINSNTIADNEGNLYKTVIIGKQTWMAENLKSAKYNNGDLIPTTVPAYLDISSEETPKYQWSYNGIEVNVDTYGRLYTWYAATDSRGICPTGWHIPSSGEWMELIDYLINNGYGFGGTGEDIAKSFSAKTNWEPTVTEGSPGNDPGTNNSSGFSALPGGRKISACLLVFGDEGKFAGRGTDCLFWASDGSSVYYSINNAIAVNKYCEKEGYPVRCLKD